MNRRFLSEILSLLEDIEQAMYKAEPSLAFPKPDPEMLARFRQLRNGSLKRMRDRVSERIDLEREREEDYAD